MASAHCKCAGFRTYKDAAASNALFFCQQCDRQRRTNIPRPSPIRQASLPVHSFARSSPAHPTPTAEFVTPNTTPTSPAISASAFSTPSLDLDLFNSQHTIPIHSSRIAVPDHSDIRSLPPPQFHIPPSPYSSPPHPRVTSGNQQSNSHDHIYAVPSLMSIDTPTAPNFIPTPHPDLPNLDLVLSTHINTLSHIPRSCRDSCCFTLSTIYGNIVSAPSVFNWSLLLIFAKLILAVPARGGRNSRNIVSIVNDRLKLWSQGQYVSLWKAAEAAQSKVRRRQQQHQHSNPSQESFNAKRAEAKGRAGQYRNALQALSSEGLADDTDDVLEALRRKHPQAPPPTLPDGSCPAPIPIPPDSVKSAILSFNTDTAPGPSGLRANHLKDLLSSPNPNQRQRFFSAITSLVNSMNQGKIPEEVRPFLFAATLHAAKKKQGGIRPIAIGDVYARLTSKCLAFLSANEAVSAFSPFQLGIKVRGGCESVIHATSTTFSSNLPIEERYILQLDLENAYNNVDRSHFLAETRKRFPTLSSWAEVSYGTPSHLFFRGHRLTSSVGTKQGDPAAGILFGAGLQPIIEKINLNVPDLVANQWIMDDVTLIGRLVDLKKVVDIISTDGPNMGFFLNKAKSSIWVGHHFADNSDPTGLGIPKADPRGIQLLGSPIGTDEFMQEVVQERISEIEQTIVSKLSSIENPQIQLCLLRSCLSLPKITYTLRTCKPAALASAYKRFDGIQFSALGEILSAPISPIAWRQATLPVSLGGLGLRSASSHASAAYLSSLVQTKAIVDEILMSFPSRHDLDFPLSLFRTAAGSLPPDVTASLSLDNADFSQKHLSYLIDSNSHSTLLKEAQTAEDRRSSARLLSLTLPQAGAFLNAIPNPVFGLSIIAENFRVALQYRLGLPVYNSSHPCPSCGKESDIYGDHTITCASEYERIHRHDTIRDAIYDSAKHAGLSPIKEARVVLNSQSRPGDIFLQNWKGRQTAFDVAVTSPLSQTALPQSHKIAGAALASMKSTKFNKHSRPCQVNGVAFIPLVVETLGGWDADAVSHLRAIAKHSAARAPLTGENASRHLFQRLSVLLQRANAGMIAARAPPLPPPHVLGF